MTTKPEKKVLHGFITNVQTRMKRFYYVNLVMANLYFLYVRFGGLGVFYQHLRKQADEYENKSSS